MRVGRVLAVLPTQLTLAFGLVGVAVAARKVFPEVIQEPWAWAVLVGSGLGVAASVVWAAVRKLPPHAGAIVLDDHFRLHGRLTNAIEFSEVEASDRTALMEAAIALARTWGGVEMINIAVSANSPGALRLYESLGFVQWGREPRVTRVGGSTYDEIHLAMDLGSARG